LLYCLKCSSSHNPFFCSACEWGFHPADRVFHDGTMSDTESKFLQTAPSVCSEAEHDQESTVGVRSLSSIDLVHQHQIRKSRMTDRRGQGEGYEGFKPGHQLPPHHRHYGNRGGDGDVGHHEVRERPPVPPLQKQTSTHKWSLELSESLSASTSSPRKEPATEQEREQEPGNAVPVISVDPRLPRYGSHTNYEDMLKNMSEQDPFQGDYMPSDKPRKSGSRDRKKKSRKLKERNTVPSLSLGATDDAGEPRKRHRDSKSKRRKAETESVNSTGTYTVEDGHVNPAYDGGSVRVREERQKAGIPRNASNGTFTMESSDGPVVQNQQDEQSRSVVKSLSWYTETIPKPHTSRETKSQMAVNKCGRDIEWHKEKGLTVSMDTSHIWHSHTHTEEMPCDSFGEIHFCGFGSQTPNSPYMRVDEVSDMEKVWTVLTEYWCLPIPKLLISVTGGAKRFTMKPRLKNILKQGLVNAAVSTGAWIITGGTAAGVMEFVGEAVQDHIQATGDPEGNQCVALGIASWGVIANSLALDGEGDMGLFPANYSIEDIIEDRKRTALDHNHTHFLLVDDGTEGLYGREIEFRSKLESYISSKVETGVTEVQSVHVPSVLIVVEGGVGTMKTVMQSVKRNMPVVVIDGSGRAADFIAIAYRLTKSVTDEDKTVYPSDFDNVMLAKGKQLFEYNGFDEKLMKSIHESLRILKMCLENRRLLNVFHLYKADSVKDIDRAILYALLRANKSNAKSQLALALAWNRCDIARQEIFTTANRHQWEHVDLYNAMFTALVQNRADFVQLFLDNGVDLKRFLTVQTLWNLYCNCIRDESDAGAQLLRFLISYMKQSWAAFLLCRGTPDFENFPDLLCYIGRVVVLIFVEQGLVSARRKQKVTEEFDFESPEKELFLWAILFNRPQLVQLFWRHGCDHLGSALFASALLRQLSEVADDEEEAELSDDMAAHAAECEKWAVSVLSECYSRDKNLTHKLLIREQPRWGKTTLFKIADSYEMMEFTGHSACQTKLSSIWKGRMALYTSELKICLCVFLPILVPFIKFTLDPKAKSEEEEDYFGEDSVDGEVTSPGRSPQHKNRVTPELPDDDGDGVGFARSKTRRRTNLPRASRFNKVDLFDFTTDNVNIFSAIYHFYQAPVTKFFCNILAYLVFIALFSYFVLVELAPADHPDSPSVFEYLTWAWLATMVLEELRQVVIRDQHSFKYKVRNWWGNMWNRFDGAMYLMFLIAIGLRYQLTGDNFVWARITYSITLGMFYLRLMQYFYVEKNMGPKVIMIKKMLTDLMFFFFILFVFVLSFGVAYHANMFPQSPPSWTILYNVLYFPYFQMYGELFLENMQGDDIDGCTRNETIWREDPSQRCPAENAIVPTLLALFMILTNILLVNLLIAMFSYTFQQVQDNSLKVWRFNRLALVFEYFDRPTLVPPIIIVNHIFRVFRWAVARKTGTGKRPNAFKWRMEPDEHNRLMLFERSAMESYLSYTKQMSKKTLDNRVANTAKQIELVMEELEMIKESIQQQETMRANAAGMAGESGDSQPPDEANVMERSGPIESLSRHQSQSQQDELERLRKTVEDVSAQNTSMAIRLEKLTAL
ncbi:hypothetical protein BaRGS_00017487, partial [Batillaria attramentaria]